MTTQWKETSKEKPIIDSDVIWIDPEGKEIAGKYNGSHHCWTFGFGMDLYYDPLKKNLILDSGEYNEGFIGEYDRIWSRWTEAAPSKHRSYYENPLVWKYQKSQPLSSANSKINIMTNKQAAEYFASLPPEDTAEVIIIEQTKQ